MIQEDIFQHTVDDTNKNQVGEYPCPRFDLATHIENLPLQLVENFLPTETANYLLEHLQDSVAWHQPEIFIAGKSIPIPRKQAWFGNEHYEYTYSGKSFIAENWHPLLIKLKDKIQRLSGLEFNSALCNLYRDGRDSVSWHADDEPELGPKPIIASYSLGETRSFHFRGKDDRNQRLKLELRHNSLLIMGPGVQESWEHQLPKTAKHIGPRINITFRNIVSQG